MGGTGKEVGDRHPKVDAGVILHSGATVLGNLNIGKGAVVTSKSIVTKEVPPLARVSGVPATVKSYREDIITKKEKNAGEDVEECRLDDLDCRIFMLYERYMVELDELTEMQLCIDGGGKDCWEKAADMMRSDDKGSSSI